MLRFFFVGIIFFLAIGAGGQSRDLICVEVKGQPSKILDNSRDGVMDTILFLLHGRITKRASGEDNVWAINLNLKNVVDGSLANAFTDENGNFKIWGMPGTYDLEISSLGMERIFIRKLRLGQGESRLINAVLGPGTYYEMKEK